MKPKLSCRFLLCLLVTALLLTMIPFIAMAASQQVYATDPGDFFDPGEVFINVGEIVAWTRENPTVNIHTIIADTTQGDYRGNKCYEPGGLNGYLYQVNIFYHHQFSVAQDCYYRCTFHPPDPSTGYPGMQGVIHVINPNGATTTTTTSTITPTIIITTTTTTMASSTTTTTRTVCHNKDKDRCK